MRPLVAAGLYDPAGTPARGAVAIFPAEPDTLSPREAPPPVGGMLIRTGALLIGLDIPPLPPEFAGATPAGLENPPPGATLSARTAGLPLYPPPTAGACTVAPFDITAEGREIVGLPPGAAAGLDPETPSAPKPPPVAPGFAPRLVTGFEAVGAPARLDTLSAPTPGVVTGLAVGFDAVVDPPLLDTPSGPTPGVVTGLPPDGVATGLPPKPGFVDAGFPPAPPLNTPGAPDAGLPASVSPPTLSVARAGRAAPRSAPIPRVSGLLRSRLHACVGPLPAGTLVAHAVAQGSQLMFVTPH